MLLLQIFIIKLLLIYPALSVDILEIIINKDERFGLLANDAKLTEFQPFNIKFNSTTGFPISRAECKHIKTSKLIFDRFLIPSPMNVSILPDNIMATKDMNGKWRCNIIFYDSSKLQDVKVKVTVAEEKYHGLISILLNENDSANTVNSTLWLNKPFTLKIKNNIKRVKLTTISCSYIRNINVNFIDLKNLTYDVLEDIYKVEQGKASKIMHDEWRCFFNGFNYRNITFEVTVKSLDFKLRTQVLVNEKLIDGSEVDSQNLLANYTYFDREMVKVTCKLLDGAMMNMNITREKNNNDWQTISTKPSDTITQTVYLKLNKLLNTYVACIVRNSVNNVLQTLTLKFHGRNDENDLNMPSMKVNGLKLASTYAIYEYFQGEPLNILITNQNDWIITSKTEGFQDAVFHYDKPFIFSKEFEGSQYMKLQSTSNEIIVFKIQPDPNNFEDFRLPRDKQIANIVINGLSYAQTQMKYQENKTSYITEFFNEGNKALNLTCMYNPKKVCKWAENTALLFHNGSSNIVKFIPPENSSTLIKCVCQNKIHQVTILRDNTEDVEVSTSQYQDISDTSLIGSSQAFPKKKAKDGQNWTLWIIIAAAVLIVITLITIIVKLFKRGQKQKQEDSRINYETLTHDNGGMLPTPPQWENHYSETMDRVSDTSVYSSPYEESNVEEMYAKPVPKGLRKPTKELYSEPNYCTIQKRVKPQISSRNPYSNVLTTSTPRSKDSTKYVNVLGDKKYVNKSGASQDTSEYAEPAYSEVNFN